MKAREKVDVAFLQALGNRISTMRKQKHISQVELGRQCDIEKPNMRRIEAGDTNPTVLTLKKIAAGLDVTLTELLDFTTE